MPFPSRLPLRVLLVLAVALGLAAPALAQSGTVTGRVVDAATGEPVPTAAVALWDVADSTLVTGGVTEPDGRFRVEAVPPGRYEVVVRFVGFAEHAEAVEVAAGRTVDLGTVGLQPDVAVLEDVEVTARRQAVEVQADRTVYSFADDPLVAGGTATDLLEQVPSVEVDLDGNVALRGSSNVTVLVNGRPAPVPPDLVADYLRQLPAEAIDRVEVIPAPSARYEPDGTAGLLNIVLREDTDPGLGGSLALTGDSRGSTSATGLLTFARGPWSLAADVSLRRDVREAGRSTFRISRSDTAPETLRDELGEDDRRRLSNRLGLTAEYAVSPRTALRAQGSLRLWEHAEDQLLGATFLDAARTPLGTSRRTVADEERRTGGDVRLGLRHRFDDAGDHRLEADGRVDLQVRERFESIAELPNGDAPVGFLERETALDRTDRRVALDLDYLRPFLGGRLETGYAFFVRLQERDFRSRSRRAAEDAFAPDAGLTNASEYGLWIHALYAQWTRRVGALDLQAGLRLETARTDFTVLDQGETFTNRYASAFPSASAALRLGEADRLRAGYSRRVRRPRTDHQNPFPRFDDPLNVYVGNPSIRPEFTDAFELGYVRFLPWGSLQVGPYARRTTDRITYVVTVEPDGTAIRTVANLATTTTVGGEGVLAFEALGDRLRGTLALDVFRTTTTGDAEGVTLERDTFGWGGRASLTWRADALGLGGTVLQLNGRYRAGMRTEQGRSEPFLFTNLALRQPLLDDRATLTLALRDPLGTARAAWVLDQPRLYQEVERDWGAQRVQLTLSWRFNQPEPRRERLDDGDDVPDPNPGPEF